jgi:Protein of unknown function (DUF2971)
MRLQVAKMNGLGHLYHYQRFKTEWLETIVHDSKMHCAGPRDFNDPWDCRPCYDQSILDDPEIYRERTDPSFLKSLLHDMIGIDRPIHERFRVLCLSAKPDSVVMWSHYADKHRGICLEFSTDNEEFSGAYKVEYCQKYPSYNLTDQSLEHNLLPLVTKSAEWSHADAEALWSARAMDQIGSARLFNVLKPAMLQAFERRKTTCLRG